VGRLLLAAGTATGTVRAFSAATTQLLWTAQGCNDGLAALSLAFCGCSAEHFKLVSDAKSCLVKQACSRVRLLLWCSDYTASQQTI
jgi:hypothetical protein